MAIITIPGQGEVEFPDSMSDEQINAAVKNLMGKQSPIQQGMQSQQQEPQPSWADYFRPGIPSLSQLANNPIINFINQTGRDFAQPLLGAADVARAPLQMAAHAIAPQQVQQFKPAGEGLLYQGGNIGAAFMPQNLVFKIPGFAQKLGGALGLGARAVITGATESFQENMGTGFLEGALGQVGGEGIVKAIKGLMPERLTKKLLEGLTGGKSPEEAAAAFAKNIGNAGLGKRSDLGKEYAAIEKQLGHEEIYPRSAYGRAPMVEGSKGFVKTALDLNKVFSNKPTYSNARKLISSLKEDERKLQSAINAKAPNAIDLGHELARVKNHRGKIESDLVSFLEKRDPKLASKYRNLNERYAEEVGPYYKNKSIAKLLSSLSQDKGIEGAEINIESLINLFKSPSSKASIKKITKDIGPEGINNLIASRLAKSADSKELIKNFNDLKNSQLSSYISPELAGMIKGIEKAQKHKKIALYGTGITGGLGAVGGGGYGALSHLLNGMHGEQPYRGQE